MTPAPSTTPTIEPLATEPTYMPGNLTTRKLDLLLSEGLDARIVAITGQNVPYSLGDRSIDVFHQNPDAGATFPDPNEGNPGGWIYTSNSEVDFQQGGVGALTFDKNGNVIDYRMVLKNSTMNCGGGRTPWNTWISCEEIESVGQIFQVDPTGKRNAQVITLGSDGGRWESFAYDDRDRNTPRFFATEDHRKGAVRRFTPDNPNWDDPWEILHGSGKTDFLVLFPNETMNGGTFTWIDNLDEARSNAKEYYPMTEGIDVYKGTMVFVCKKMYVMFVLDLDSKTYYNQTTAHGLFDGKPDQVERVLADTQDLLYFTEEGGVDAGVHARDHLGRFYTIFESPVFPDETTGLSFSPDGRFMYTAYQKTGVLYTIWRKDGLPFQASHLDVKFHNNGLQQG
jgi:sugar lactone lactonase YvrE